MAIKVKATSTSIVHASEQALQVLRRQMTSLENFGVCALYGRFSISFFESNIFDLSNANFLDWDLLTGHLTGGIYNDIRRTHKTFKDILPENQYTVLIYNATLTPTQDGPWLCSRSTLAVRVSMG